ncbi:hypothetical protein [Egicoccus sp. AB-alg6-2]|uniref:hypothetical protein n=1 Tax=Egicoccus sp. AB-alg6-2 TaxID=3242692 RepID=UPI00359DFA5E
MDEQDGGRHRWAAPEGSAWTADDPPTVTHWGAEEPDADGPPPPPFVRRRQRRRRVASVVAVVAVLLLVPVGLLWAGVIDRPEPEAAGPTGEPTPTESPSPDAELRPPDPADFTGSDADFATLLTGVEASERTMLTFQEELAQTFELAEGTDLTPFFAAVRSVAAANAMSLAEARADLEQPLETLAAESVRTVYLDHLDAWLELMETAAEDPTVFGPAGDTARFDVAINATAVDFSRALEAELPDDAAPEISRHVRELLDRGFRFDGEAQA